jgi:hypothetical protein
MAAADTPSIWLSFPPSKLLPQIFQEYSRRSGRFLLVEMQDQG